MRADAATNGVSRRLQSLPLTAEAPATASALPFEVARQAQREMDRLRRLPAGSPEAAQVRGYLQ